MSKVDAGTSRSRFSRRSVQLTCLAVIGAIVAADQTGLLLVGQADDMGTYHGRAVKVINTLDGQTIEVEHRDALHGRPTTQVRLWGVAAPQPPRPGREGEAMWEESLAHAASLALGRQVMLQLEAGRTRDPQGRLLAHAELPVGGTLNEAMLSAGFVRRDEQWPHTMLTAYAQAENRARRTRTGIWSGEPPRPRGE